MKAQPKLIRNDLKGKTGFTYVIYKFFITMMTQYQ